MSSWLNPFAEIELTYTSGYTTIPDEVKMAVSLIARNFPLRPVANAKRIKAGMQEIEFKDFGESFIPPEADAILSKYVKGLVV